jgi:hypothetical protein
MMPGVPTNIGAVHGRRHRWRCAGTHANVVGVEEKPRYPIRRGAIELSRRQWILLGGILIVGIVTATVLIAAATPAAGGIALGTTAVAAGLTIGFGRHPRSHR